jgi:hypothetical protein
MFAPNPEVAIKEMRVTKSGGDGRIAFSTWPAELVNGELFKVMTKHAPPPQSPSSPHLQFNGEFQKLYKSV